MAPVSTDTAQTLLTRLREALSRAGADEDFRRRGRWLDTRCLVGIDQLRLLMEVRRGELTVTDTMPPLTSWDFALHGSSLAWENHWQWPPPAGWHDLLALAKRGELRIEGDLHSFMTHLQYFKDLLALPREARGPRP